MRVTKITSLIVFDSNRPNFAYKICESSGKYYVPEEGFHEQILAFHRFDCNQEQLVPIKRKDVMQLSIGEKAPFAYCAYGEYVIGWTPSEFARKLFRFITSRKLPYYCMEDYQDFLRYHKLPQEMTLENQKLGVISVDEMMQILSQVRSLLTRLAISFDLLVTVQESTFAPMQEPVSYEEPVLIRTR